MASSIGRPNGTPEAGQTVVPAVCPESVRSQLRLLDSPVPWGRQRRMQATEGVEGEGGGILHKSPSRVLLHVLWVRATRLAVSRWSE
jgi:hypothetical protein